MKYIKIPLAEADEITTISESMLVEGLNIDQSKDIREYLNYTVYKVNIINGVETVVKDDEEGEYYSYVVKGIFDLVNKNRLKPSSEAEIEMWDAIIAEHPNWSEVETLPSQELEL